ncbi:MAG: hypothetical protein Q9220_006038 [cf. Caloplaca sp. 1 TL-2023]
MALVAAFYIRCSVSLVLSRSPKALDSSYQPSSTHLFRTLADDGTSTLLESMSASALQQVPPSLQSIRSQWTTGLIQYTEFRLHTALGTFKSLLRALECPGGGRTKSTAYEENLIEAVPFQVLLPEEIGRLYINIALIHAYLGSYFLAAAAFEEVLLVDETSAIAWYGLGIAKFYLGELGASKKAFSKCQACFTSLDEQGNFLQKDVLVYDVWIKDSEPRCGLVKDGCIDADRGTSHQVTAFQDVLCSGLEDGQWKLERMRVEWNWRIAMFERNWVRKQVERPGGGKWGLNGIPAGVVFGPDCRHGRGLSSTARRIDSVSTTRDQGDFMTRTLSGNYVKQKWIALIRKVSNGKTDTPIATRTWKAVQDEMSRRSSKSPDEHPKSVQRFGTWPRPSRRPTVEHLTEINRGLQPGQSLEDGHIHPSLDFNNLLPMGEASFKTKQQVEVAAGPAPVFHSRLSSSARPRLKLSIPPRRSSKIYQPSVGNLHHDFESIEEVLFEDERVKSYYGCGESAHAASPSEERTPDVGAPRDSMAVSPLLVRKGERMGITGRTCLGEWEWEAAYERWQAACEQWQRMLPNGDDSDTGLGSMTYSDGDKDVDEDDRLGEILKPRRFDGFWET